MYMYHRDFNDPSTYLVEPLILQSRILRPRVSPKTRHSVAEPNLLIPGNFHQYLYRRCCFFISMAIFVLFHYSLLMFIFQYNKTY